jgi:hypothetical protein
MSQNLNVPDVYILGKVGVGIILDHNNIKVPLLAKALSSGEAKLFNYQT